MTDNDKIIALLTRIAVAVEGRPAARPSQPAQTTFAGALPTSLPPYGKSKNAPIDGASLQDLEYYANGCRRTLADEGKQRFHDKERAMLAAIEAELARQRAGGPAVDVGDASSAGDDEIPF